MTVRRAGAVAATLAISAVVMAAPAPADAALNGTFRAISNGEWAATNGVYRDEATVVSVWTISMSCSNVVTCAGRVDSDAGWSADVVTTNGEYIVKRVHPGWEPCADGRSVTGHQMYRFFPLAPGGLLTPGSPIFGGFDVTSGESGGCSLNDKLQIEMPFRLERLS